MDKFDVYGFLGKLVARLICAVICGVLAFLGWLAYVSWVPSALKSESDLNWACGAAIAGAAAGFILGKRALMLFTGRD
jgi:hypothetical protein